MLQREELADASVPIVNAERLPRWSVAFTGVFELWTTPACTDSAPPGLATALTNRDNPQHGWLLRLGFLPNTAIPAVSRAWPVACRLPFFSVQPRNDVLGSLDPAYLAISKRLVEIAGRKRRCSSGHLCGGLCTRSNVQLINARESLRILR